ncbi:hypothetical protein KY321_05245 [Candidatus Woesearchaeota archaeon]|nr:hypothetical protein [Candidatus Woesearchaeota archaeon]
MAKKSVKKTKKKAIKMVNSKKKHPVKRTKNNCKDFVNKELSILRKHLIISFSFVFILLFLLFLKTSNEIHFNKTGLSFFKIIITMIIILGCMIIYENHRHKKDI